MVGKPVGCEDGAEEVGSADGFEEEGLALGVDDVGTDVGFVGFEVGVDVGDEVGILNVYIINTLLSILVLS